MDSFSTSDTPEAKLHFLDYWRIIRIRKTVILTVFFLVVLTTTGVTFYLPEWYSSDVRILVDKDTPDVEGIGTRQPTGGYDPFWLQTELERIKSKSVLYPVINDQKLEKKWAVKMGRPADLTDLQVYEILKKQIDVKVTKNTSLIEIWVYSRDKQEATDIANEIALQYKMIREQNRSDYKKRGIEQLNKDLELAKQEVLVAQTNVDTMRETNKIVDLGPDGLAQVSTIGAETIRRLEEQRITIQMERAKWETLYERLTNMTPVELEKALPTAIPDQELTSLLESFHSIKQREVMLNSQLGEKHDSVIQAKAVKAEIQSQLDAKIQGVLAGLLVQVQHARSQYETLTNEFDRAKQSDIDLGAKTRPYYEAKQNLELLKQVKNALMLRIKAEEVEKELPTGSKVQVVDPAEPGEEPVRPNKPLNIVLGVIVGLVVGIGLAFFIEYLDTSVKTIDDVEKALQAPVLGVIPQNVGTILDEGPESPHAEAYRVLRTNLLFSRKDESLNSLTVVSGGAGEGKSTTLFNLATVFAQNGHRVLVVDSDLRRPSIHKMVKVSNSIGLTNYLLKQNTLEEVIQTTKLPTLDVMASGKLPSSSMGILSSVQMKNLVAELKRRYDFVFFDSPPIMGVSDASILASEVDLVLQVIQYRRYPQPMTVRAKQMIQKVGGNLLGLVLNNINMSQDENYYYYSGYYYNYYSKPDQEEGSSRAAAATATANGQSSSDTAKVSKPRIKSKF